jgi:hypothetical protein
VTEHTLHVTFCYDDYRDLEVDEAPCVAEPSDPADPSAIDLFRALAAENEDEMGTVTISYGSYSAGVEDSLYATVANLCLGPAAELAAGKDVEMRYFLTYGFLRLAVEGDEVVVSGDFVPTGRVPRQQLLAALVDCGRRFVELFDRIRPEEEFRAQRESIHGDLVRAQAVLGGGGSG